MRRKTSLFDDLVGDGYPLITSGICDLRNGVPGPFAWQQFFETDVRFGSKKQTLGKLRPMSALPPKADMEQQGGDVRFVPKADICGAANSTLFDHLVGARQQRLRDGDAERFRRLEIDRQFKFGRRLHR